MIELVPGLVNLGLLLILAVTLLRVLASMLLGPGATSHMIGILAAEVVRWAVALPVRLLRRLLR